jgi:hypothetical protein
MAAAQREARPKARLFTTNPTHACSDAIGITQTAKRSVTRMSDNGHKKKKNELDPNAQLEKQSSD